MPNNLHLDNLSANLRAHRDYTRAVISERDAMKAELEVAKADAYHCREALWKACGDDEEHVNAYLEAVKP
jgi:hypothetical protein